MKELVLPLLGLAVGKIAPSLSKNKKIQQIKLLLECKMVIILGVITYTTQLSPLGKLTILVCML